jgi:hypothetical protein
MKTNTGLFQPTSFDRERQRERSSSQATHAMLFSEGLTLRALTVDASNEAHAELFKI